MKISFLKKHIFAPLIALDFPTLKKSLFFPKNTGSLSFSLSDLLGVFNILIRPLSFEFRKFIREVILKKFKIDLTRLLLKITYFTKIKYTLYRVLKSN